MKQKIIRWRVERLYQSAVKLELDMWAAGMLTEKTYIAMVVDKLRDLRSIWRGNA